MTDFNVLNFVTPSTADHSLEVPAFSGLFLVHKLLRTLYYLRTPLNYRNDEDSIYFGPPETFPGSLLLEVLMCLVCRLVKVYLGPFN